MVFVKGQVFTKEHRRKLSEARMGKIPWNKFPELRYELNNGITLCKFHHPRRRAEEVVLAPIFKELVSTPVN